MKYEHSPLDTEFDTLLDAIEVRHKPVFDAIREQLNDNDFNIRRAFNTATVNGIHTFSWHAPLNEQIKREIQQAYQQTYHS